ncbi:MAG: acetylxylan esterase [Candidatus Marinimicrobia bacterium]|nr:acetylxylan esterase [Candidatus Neomarinimicrobiota bacterium]
MNRRSKITLLLIGLIGLGSVSITFAQAPDTVAGIPVNYDESKVEDYELPPILQLENGEKVTDQERWSNQRRSEILEYFRKYQYGRIPVENADIQFDVFDKGSSAFKGEATRKQVNISFMKNTTGPNMDVLIYLPSKASKPVPILLMINFTANSSMVNDPGVKRGMIWNREHQKVPAPEKSIFGSFDVMQFLKQGIGIAMVYYGDIEPDFDGGIQYGVRSLFMEPDQEKPAPDEWGAISAWTFGLSRIMDYLETDKDVDGDQVALFGVSRLGKTVLWAGARDPRFAMVIASCSGEGGAALSRRNFGETIAHLTAPSRYDYQFCANYQKFAKNPDNLPMDSHMLLALMAPRPLLLQTGSKDLWSDPKGEFLAAIAAEPAYHLFGKKGLKTNQMPAPGEKIYNTIGYFMHEGGHGTKPSDYPLIIDFIQQHFDLE